MRERSTAGGSWFGLRFGFEVGFGVRFGFGFKYGVVRFQGPAFRLGLRFAALVSVGKLRATLDAKSFDAAQLDSLTCYKI
jgi:hypothetical protein